MATGLLPVKLSLEPVIALSTVTARVETWSLELSEVGLSSVTLPSWESPAAVAELSKVEPASTSARTVAVKAKVTVAPGASAVPESALNTAFGFV
jgi:hypothetical protein